MRTTTATAASRVRSAGRIRTDHLFFQRDDLRRLVRTRIGILLGEPLRDRLQLGRRPSDRGFGFEPGDHREEVAAASRVRGIQRDGAPELDFARREKEIRRHDADDRHRLAAEREGAPEHARITGESALPHPVAEHDDAVLPREILRLGKATAEHRRDFQEVEEIPRDGGGDDAFGAVAACEGRGAAGEGGDPGERGRLFAPVEKGRRRDRESAVLRHDLEQANEAIRLRIRQRPQKHAVHDAEDRAGGADPESQREDGDDREAGGLSELSNRVARIAQDVHRHGEPAPSRWMDSVEPIRQPLDRRPGVRAVGEPQILCHPLPVADLPGGVGVRLGVGFAASDRLAVEVFELRRELLHDPRLALGSQARKLQMRANEGVPVTHRPSPSPD